MKTIRLLAGCFCILLASGGVAQAGFLSVQPDHADLKYEVNQAANFTIWVTMWSGDYDLRILVGNEV